MVRKEINKTEFKFTIPGEPFGKQRPRCSVYGGHAHMYTPPETVAYEKEVRKCFNDKYENQSVTGELKVHIVAYFAIANSLPKIKKQHMFAGLVRPIKRPDIDNIMKVVIDALNEVAFHDDSQIIELLGEKYYSGDEPRVEVTIIGDMVQE